MIFFIFQVNEEPHRNGFATDFQASKLKSNSSGVGTAACVNDVSMSCADTTSDELSESSDESDIDVH